MTTAEKHEFPMARTCPFAPPPAYEEISEQEHFELHRGVTVDNALLAVANGIERATMTTDPTSASSSMAQLQLRPHQDVLSHRPVQRPRQAPTINTITARRDSRLGQLYIPDARVEHLLAADQKHGVQGLPPRGLLLLR
ncbi:hypothetical protein [Nonomuraea sediminis]|uniref:hypothetical protein n=1 Tax=Nonomuraea sediminis TaxID=2835864 RepID=UPI001BDC2870|nr:hypothetical protein [Nonomuraea sediminis]